MDRHGRVNISGVFPHLAVVAEHTPRTETGIGALMPWANRLWFVTYVSSKAGSGGGTGLFEVDGDLNLRKCPQSVVGTYANRMIHHATSQLIIGPHFIDAQGNVRTAESLVDIRLAATATHLKDPKNLVYMLGMEGELLETDVHSLETRRIADLVKELGLEQAEHPHFKDAYTAHGRLVVANNTRTERDYLNQQQQGALAEWDGRTWTVLERRQFNTVTGRKSIGDAIFAVGADNASVLLKVFARGQWSTYRLPKATQTQDHGWTTEWPRIREVESERWLMDAGGMFYELPAMHYGGQVWGVRPISTHLRIIPDFCSWRGMLVLAGDQTTPIHDSNLFVGQPQANLWLGHTDELWRFGKPQGWGGPWRDTPVKPGQPSDPYLMTGFEHKCLHLSHDAGREVTFALEVDFLGDGRWNPCRRLSVPADGYLCHILEPGFSAHWVRLAADAPCRATAWFVYT
jgi:hypothetical protein